MYFTEFRVNRCWINSWKVWVGAAAVTRTLDEILGWVMTVHRSVHVFTHRWSSLVSVPVATAAWVTDWLIWLITGQPHVSGNTSQRCFYWLCTENPRLRCSFIHVKYPIRVAGFRIFMLLLAFLFVCFIVFLPKRTSQMSSFCLFQQ